MVFQLKACGAVSAIVGMVTIGATPLFAAERAGQTERVTSVTERIEWARSLDAMTRRLAAKHPDVKLPVDELGDASATRLTPTELLRQLNVLKQRTATSPRVGRLAALMDGFLDRSPAERHAFVKTLGVSVTKTRTADSVVSSFSVNGAVQLTITTPTAAAILSRGPRIEQPDGGTLSAREYYSVEEAGVAADDAVAWATDVESELYAIADDAGSYSEIPIPEAVVSGPFADGAPFNCVGEAEAAWGAAIVGAWGARQVINAIRAAFTNLNTAVAAIETDLASGALTWEAYVAAMRAALLAFEASLSWEVVGLVGLGLVALAGYELWKKCVREREPLFEVAHLNALQPMSGTTYRLSR